MKKVWEQLMGTIPEDMLDEVKEYRSILMKQ
jgi:hypothetical protein